MKVLSAIFTTIGVLGIIMTVFTVFGISPAFLSNSTGISDMFTTAIFWAFLSLIMILAGIAYGIIDREI